MVPPQWMALTGFSGAIAGLFFSLGWVYFYVFGKYDPLGAWLGVVAHALMLPTLAGWHTLLLRQARGVGLAIGLAGVGCTLVVLTSIPLLAHLSTVRAGQIALEVEPVAPYVGGGPALLAVSTERPATSPFVDAVADAAGVVSLLGLAGCAALIVRSPTPLPRPAGWLLLIACALALVAFINNPVLNTAAGLAFGVPIVWMSTHLLSELK